MEIKSPRGFYFSTSEYDREGNNARIFGHWERQQDDAQITRNQEFTLRFWSHGGTVQIGTRAARTPFNSRFLWRGGSKFSRFPGREESPAGAS